MRRPTPTATSQPYWTAAVAGSLSFPRCASCATWHTYPRPWCPQCLHEPLELSPVSGLGTVYAATAVYRPPAPSFADLVPYTFALVDLDEGVRVVTMITGCAPDSVKPGMHVRAVVDVPDAEDQGAAPLIFFTPDD
jgi:uncharacterized OB-fold protein